MMTVYRTNLWVTVNYISVNVLTVIITLLVSVTVIN